MANLISIEKVKDELRMDYTEETWDAILNDLVDEVEELWDELTGRTWFKTTHTEYHDSPRNNKAIILRNYPLQSVTSIYDDPERVFAAGDLVASTDYSINYKDGIIINDGQFFEGTQSIKVTYVAGYTDATGTGNLPIPKWLKRILVRQVAFWYTQGKERDWGISSSSDRSGGTKTYRDLKNNLLPDFERMVEKHRRRSY